MSENADAEEMLTANTESLHEGLTSITKEIRELRKEMVSELTTFKEEFKADFLQEFNAFKAQMDKQMSANSRAVVKKSIRDPISIHAEKARYRSKNVWIDLFQVTKGTIFFDAQGAL